MTLLLSEQHVTELLDMPTAMSAVEEVLRHQAEGAATNRPRQRVAMPASLLHVMAAGDKLLGVCGIKTYVSARKGTRFLVLLYDSASGDLLTIIEADRLGQMRTGAASGVATKYMAREDAGSVGIFGTGWQAESQLMAICHARKIKSITAYGRDRQRRESFCRKMTAALRVEVTPAESPEDAARDKAIIVTATTAREPVLKGEWVSPGTHINAAGSNFLSKIEADVETIRKATVIAVDSIDQARMESGDLLPAIERGVTTWESVTELGRIVAGQVRGRTSPQDVTLFESHGIAIWDIAVALRVYKLARERGLGDVIQVWNRTG
ncbi:MAG TPA: ornithine cyclodeaminase family protein [Blastocatellia bacterium]|nr:ornithine cyclodeaminase family protein [Blastocatellia bacterium]